jgi:hypothetical protein
MIRAAIAARSLGISEFPLVLAGNRESPGQKLVKKARSRTTERNRPLPERGGPDPPMNLRSETNIREHIVNNTRTVRGPLVNRLQVSGIFT